MKIAILGAGAWGTALAVSACSNPDAAHQVTLWARDPQQTHALQDQRVNQRYLPGVALPPRLAIRLWPVHGAIDAASQMRTATLLADQDLIVVATPMAALRECLGQLRNCTAPVAWLCKGFEPAQAGAAAQSSGPPDGLLAHEVLAQAAPGLHAGVLSGPSFALEVARGQPTALVADRKSVV